MASPASPAADSFIVSDSDSGDDDSVWAMDLDDDDAAADTPPVAPRGLASRSVGMGGSVAGSA